MATENHMQAVFQEMKEGLYRILEKLENRLDTLQEKHAGLSLAIRGFESEISGLKEKIKELDESSKNVVDSDQAIESLVQWRSRKEAEWEKAKQTQISWMQTIWKSTIGPVLVVIITVILTLIFTGQLKMP